MRYIKSRLEKIKSEMDEVKFLLSDSYRLFLQKIVHGVTGRYDIKVIFSDGVYTDNKVISVNPVHEYVMRIKGTAKKTLVILGQLAHEVFHIIYTDFNVFTKTKKTYERKGASKFRLSQLHQCFNIIEDSAIELLGTNYYTGSFKQGIIALNKNALECMPTLDEMALKGAPRLAIFKQACAMYCMLGTLKGKLHDLELIEMFEQAIPILDRGRLEPHSSGRLKAAEELYELITPLIEEAEETFEDMKAADIEFCYTKSNKIPDGPQEIVEIPEIKSDFSEESRKAIRVGIEKMKEKSFEEKDKEDASDGKTAKDKDGEKSDKSVDKDIEDGKEVDAHSSKAYTDTKKEIEEGETEKDDSLDKKKEDEKLKELLDSLEKQLEDVLEEAAKEEYDQEVQREQERKIKEFAKEVKFSAIHSHIQTRVIRNFKIDEYMINKYNQEFESIKGLCRNLTKRVRDIIRYNEDVKITGQISGKINKSQLYRLDKLFFYKIKGKSDEADLAILLLIDESGSMMREDRYRAARKAAMLLYEMCYAINIPFAVIGYDAEHKGNTVNHRHYIDFDSRDKREKYKLAYIDAHFENRDGYSIKYAGEYLARRPETDKILIVITDGSPAHPSGSDYYYGEIGIKDAGRVVKELEKKGITTFGVAIGEGKTDIKRIFTKNYIDIPELKYLPGRLANLIERNILIY